MTKWPIWGVGAQLFFPAVQGSVVDSPGVRPAAHNEHMKSRVHPKYKTRYHVRNWASYERGLVRRGDLTVWLSPEAIAGWTPDGAGKRGGQQKYSDVTIETALTLRLIFHLPLRQAEGFLTSLFGLMGLGGRTLAVHARAPGRKPSPRRVWPARQQRPQVRTAEQK